MEKSRQTKDIRAYKKSGTDLRKYYILFFEAGLILTLLLFIGLTRINIQPADKKEFVFQEQDVVEMEEIIQTKQQERVPPPPRPPVPVEVPNDVIIDDIDIDIDAELNFSDNSYLPPPPAQHEDEENEEEPEEDFFIAVEQMPELVGGMQGLQQKIRYPELAQKANISGRVYVQFIVTEK
ncbi:MAG: energy transducer TonB [Bacteroidota bacterium]